MPIRLIGGSLLHADSHPCNRIERLPEEPYHPYIPPSEDIARIKLVATKDQRDFIEVLYHTMARQGEILKLTWDDVNFEQRWVRLYTRKRRGGELQADHIPMNKSLYGVLNQRRKERKGNSDFVFRFNQYQRNFMMRTLCKRAGVRPFGFHAIRHHVASVLNNSGKASMKQIQVLLRHRRQSTTEIYLHTIGQGVRNAVEVLDEVSWS
ncbi:tyrosine-type recombinase/integrase [Thermodesulfobacteriota bacterium]